VDRDQGTVQAGDERYLRLLAMVKEVTVTVQNKIRTADYPVDSDSHLDREKGAWIHEYMAGRLSGTALRHKV